MNTGLSVSVSESNATISGKSRLCSQWTDFLVNNRWELVARYFTVVETSRLASRVVYFDDKVSRVVGPGCRVLFWRGPVEVTYDLIDAQSNPQVPALLVPALARLGARESLATFALIEEGRRGLLYVDGRFVRELMPGSYAFWNAAGTPRVDILDLRVQTMEIGRAGDPDAGQGERACEHHGEVPDRRCGLARSAVKDVCELPVPHAADRGSADARQAHARRGARGQGRHR